MPALEAIALERHNRAVHAFNAHDVDAVVDIYARNAALDDPPNPEPIRGRDAIRAAYAEMFRAFRDIQVACRNRHIHDGCMIYELRLTGTNDGPLTTPEGELPATGRTIDLPASVFADLDDDGRFHAVRRYYNVATMTRQLGIGA
ncbi:MAG: nuclear transport factor 2 family protein [Phycisphaeraceae bacterium]|nr:nuclear transport factor 2 family protein [Phycisphaeraceae bacterium]